MYLPWLGEVEPYKLHRKLRLCFAGYPMAKNLRAKIPSSDLLAIFDVNTPVTKKFVEEVGIAASSTDAPEKGTGILVAKDPREVAEKSVSKFLETHHSLLPVQSNDDETTFS